MAKIIISSIRSILEFSPENEYFRDMRAITLLFILISGRLLAQVGDSCTRLPFVNTGGLVAYYFWEEDSNGIVVPGSLVKPGVQNVYVIQNPKKKTPKKTPAGNEMQKLILDFAQSNHNYAVTTLKEEGETRREHYPLLRYSAQHYGSLQVVLRNGKWVFNVRKPVLYFSVWSNGSLSYSHSSDSVSLELDGIKELAFGQYIVNTFYNVNGSISHQSVLTYSGEDVTQMFIKPCEVKAKRCLVFVNGYRGPLKDKDKSDNLVSMKDRYGYWYKLDNRFIDRTRPDATFFLDANFPVATSIHKTRLRFTGTFIRWSLSKNSKHVRKALRRVNKKTNAAGFAYRKEKGRIAGLAFLYSKCTAPNCLGTRDTVDIVCHSMGYAYTLGFLETIQDKVVLGNCYIIAPETAGIEGFDWTKFQHVWQYGTNFDQGNPDALKYQDGVAPQFTVKGLELLDSSKGARLFFPEDWPNKQFIHSHMVYNYDWIFDRIEPGMPGYVGR